MVCQRHFRPGHRKTIGVKRLNKAQGISNNVDKTFYQRFCAIGAGPKNIQGTNTIFFITHKDVPKNKTVTYGRIVVDYHPQKADPHRTRLTVGGNRIQYPHDITTYTADLTTCNLLFNSTISTPNARFATIDIKNFYLNTPVDQFECM